MKVHVFLDRAAIQKQQQKESDKKNVLANTLTSIKEAGFVSSKNQRLMSKFGIQVGQAEEDTVRRLRKIPFVIKIRRADGRKMKIS